MTDGRPPKEGTENPAPEAGNSAQDGRRSQTRTVAGRQVSDQPASAPRSAFSKAPASTSKPAGAASSGQASRSAFQYTPSPEPPTSSDPDKTVKRPYPTNPSTWGQTLPLGDLTQAKPQAPSKLFPDAENERTVQVVRSAFVKTLISGDALTPPTPPSSVAGASTPRPPRAAAPSNPEAVGSADDTAPPEPLTVPSNRPAPTPWQQAHAVAPTGTILMPGSAGTQKAAGAGTPETPGRPPGAAPASPAANRIASSAAKKTLPLGATGLAPEDAAPVRRAPVVQQPVTAESSGAEGAAPPTRREVGSAARSPAVSAQASAPAARPAALVGKNVSEPLQLRIEARDVVPRPDLTERPVLPRNRGPLVAALLIAALLALAGLGWFGLRASPDVAPEPTRNDAVTVPATPQATTPGAAPGVTVPEQQAAPAQQPAPAQTPQPAAPAAQPAPAALSPVDPAAQKPEAPKTEASKPQAPKRESAAQKRRAERRAAARADKREAPAASADMPESVQEARDALRELESEPVMKIKPAPAEEAAEPEFPPLPEPPEPPPPPE